MIFGSKKARAITRRRRIPPASKRKKRKDGSNTALLFIEIDVKTFPRNSILILTAPKNQSIFCPQSSVLNTFGFTLFII
jgi:hypothetical protein